MEFETVRKPIGTIRKKVERLGATWAKESRTLGAAALRTSAHRLASTAEKLDDLAARLEPSDELVAALQSEAEAEPSLANNGPSDTVASTSTESVAHLVEAESLSPTDEASSQHPTTVNEAPPAHASSEHGKRRPRR